MDAPTRPQPADASDHPDAAAGSAWQEPATDLAWRWRAARRSALRASLPADAPVPDDDDALTRAALDVDAAGALQRVFDHSLKLGEGFRRAFRLDLPLRDVAGFLPMLAAPCTDRAFAPVAGETACRGSRQGCELGRADGRACGFWREAIEGLVLGMSSGVRFGRHRSLGGGDDVCSDVLFVHPESPLRFGPVEPAIAARIAPALAAAAAMDSRSRVDVLGISESVLYYRVHRLATEPSAVDVPRVFERALARRIPGLVARDVSPRPVLAPDG